MHKQVVRCATKRKSKYESEGTWRIWNIEYECGGVVRRVGGFASYHFPSPVNRSFFYCRDLALDIDFRWRWCAGQRIGEGDHGHKAMFIIWGQIVPLAETPSCQSDDGEQYNAKDDACSGWKGRGLEEVGHGGGEKAERPAGGTGEMVFEVALKRKGVAR
jgi:hypothetical protein